MPDAGTRVDAGTGDAGTEDAGPTLQTPGVPTAVTATAGDGQATVRWTAPANGGSPITSYTVTTLFLDSQLKTQNTTETQVTVTGLTNGMPYSFTVSATNALGTSGTSQPSNVVTPRTVPAAPTGVTATPANRSLVVTWSAPVETGGSVITGYTVTVQPGNHSQEVSANETRATVTGLTNGTEYTVTVAARNEAGAGPASSPVSATPLAVPSAPTAVQATPGNRQVALTWSAPADDGGSPLTGYTIHVSAGGVLVRTESSTTTSFTVLGLINGTAYSFHVTATNGTGAGLASEPVFATPRTVPGAPTQVRATAGNRSALVEWSAPDDNGGSDVTGYTLTVEAGGTVVETRETSATSLTVTGLTNGTTYRFTVTATNGVGTGAASSPVSAVPQSLPGAPTGLAVSPGNTQVSLTWTAPQDNGGNPLTGYVVTVRSGGAVVRTQDATTTNATVTGLTNGTAYSFTVSATTSVGTGLPSEPVSATPRTVPGAPTQLQATAGEGQVTVSWTAPANGGSAITGYTVLAQPGDRTVQVAGNQTQATVTGLTNGTAYTFTVTATNVAGTGAASTSVSATPRTVPAAPTNLEATPGAAQVSLTWFAPSNNGGSAVTGYVVTVRNGGTVVGTQTSSTRSATVTGLTNGTAYTFTVAATNVAGTGAASTPVNATPRTVPAAPSGLAATPDNGQVSLTWAAPTDNGGSPVTGYTVTARQGATVVGTQTSATTSATVTGLTNGTAYTFTVAATNVAGTGAVSTSVSATPRTVPREPTNVVATGGNRQVSLTWSAPTDNGGSPVTGYVVSIHQGTTVVRTQSFTTTSATVTGLTNGVNYDVTVAATNAAGTGWESLKVAFIPRTVPGAPANVVASPGNGGVTLTWSEPADTGGSGIGGYTVRVRQGGSVLSTQTTSAMNLWVSGLTNGTAYNFTVSAANSVGNGPESTAVIATPRTVPGVPTNLRATSGNSQVALAWNAPADNGGNAITGYAVTVRHGGSNAVVATPTFTATSGTVTGLTNGTSYTFTVAAMNEAGTGAATAALTATPAIAPGPPLNVRAAVFGGTVAIRWAAPLTDGGSPITEYVVTVSPGGTTHRVPAPATGTSLVGLPLASGYLLSVRALNAAGQGPAASTATTFELACEETGFPGLSLTSALDADTLLVHDVSGDGRADVILATNERPDVPVLQVRQGAGRGRLQGGVNYPMPIVADRLLLGDLNGDGRQDVVAGSSITVSPTLVTRLAQQGGTLSAAVTTEASSGPRNLALGEFTGDGRLDLVMSPANTNGQLWVLPGRGDGTFQAHIASTATGVGVNFGVGDFNRDGRADVVFSGGGRIVVMLGDGQGHLTAASTSYTAGSTDAPMAIGDFNADGAPDVAVLNSTQRTVDVLLNNGDATFRAVVRYSVGSVAATALTLGDFNRDGSPDVAVINSGSASFAVLRGRANGTFDAAVAYVGMAGLIRHGVGDIDGDGFPDIAMLRASASSFAMTDALDIAWGRADGTLERPALSYGPAAFSSAVGDFDMDGRMDMVSANGSTVNVWKGNGDGTLTSAPALTGPATSTGVTLNDLNRDGRADVVVSNGSANSISVFLAQANGTFGARVDHAAGGFVVDGAIGVGDINADGLKDLAVPTVSSGTAQISLFLGTAAGGFAPVAVHPAGSAVNFVEMADVNGDGRADVIGRNSNSATVVLKLGRADGTLEASQLIPAGINARSLTVGDYDGNGRPDLAVSDTSSLRILPNTGNGTFGAAIVSAEPVGQLGRVAGDINGDGRIDLVSFTDTANNGGGRVWILLGLGDGTFATTGDTFPSSTTSTSASMFLADMNGDSSPDLVGSNTTHGVFVLPQACF
ncbi:hypothetical protein HPC49_15380 [Pyxidicoccus fallax]|uniref:Fibronectin type-III domain-containing protein n=1 Tax=Pyxidicoccus fallax TaxID=394095 RepID=A0A848L4C3_9BACT|nr:hypothetical protein [Pyxidicoccus fallax]NPC79600.1 hypothetical protein [Pyxidicoccus fallax]